MGRMRSATTHCVQMPLVHAHSVWLLARMFRCAHQRRVRKQAPLPILAAIDIPNIPNTAEQREDIIEEARSRGEPMTHATAGGLILFLNMPAGPEKEAVAHVAARLRASYPDLSFMPSLGGAHLLRTSNKKLFDELAQDTAPTVEIANAQTAATHVQTM